MGCKGYCTSEKVFIFINIAFAMYSGALLSTAARLAWDPSTYTWFRFLCQAQYRVSAGYVLAAGLWLAALVYIAADSAAKSSRLLSPQNQPARRPYTATTLHIYAIGVICLAVSEIAYAAWMAASLAAWWRSSPQAELARRGIDLLHDIKPALLAVERYRDVAMPMYHMIEEVEQEAPNNAYVIIVFGGIGAVLQVVAVILARRLARRVTQEHQHHSELSMGEKGKEVCASAACDEDSDSGDRDPPPGWRKKANLRMYTILDKIF